MSWSPDYELVVFVTGKNTVLLMTKEWDVVSECPIDKTESTSASNNAICNVSWRGDGNYFACNATRDGNNYI
jgi:elongator complex protein 1